jgi:hypothetical protein
MVRRFEVSYFKLDKLSAVVLPCAKGDWEDNRTKWVCRITWDDAVKRGLDGNQHILEIQTHLPQSANKDEVEPASAIDEELGKLDLCHHRIEDQGELSRFRKARPLVIAGEQDGDLQTTEWSWYRRLDGHDLPEKQLLVPPGAKILISPEDDIDDLRSILELWVAPLVIVVVILGFFVRRLFVLLSTTGVAERPSKVVAVNSGVVGTWMPWALFL